MTARDTLNAAMSEADFQARIITRARTRGWHVHHARPSLNRSGKWSTAIVGNPGFPDLVLAHPDFGIVFAELKSAKGTVTLDQQEWLHAIAGFPGDIAGPDAVLVGTSRKKLHDGRFLIVAVWRPSDWPTITRIIDGDT